MKIVNPLYDIAFKYLMQEKKYAKLFIGLIIEKEIEDLELSQQETVIKDDKRNLKMFRLDFKAVIRDENGKKSTVLIELQKSKTYTDILRFRTYLGSTYYKHEKKFENNIETKYSLPIIAIYILGYELHEIPYLAIEVNNKILDKRTKEEIKIESEFIEQLNHKSHIIQVRRLPKNLKTKLERFLVFFNQAWISQEDYILDLQNIPEEYAEIAKYLQQPLADEEFVNNLKAEEEWEYNFTTIERKLYLAEQQKEEAKKREEEAKKREEEERRQKEEVKLKLAQKMKKYGESIEDIIRETGLSREVIDRL
jgi:predicted transposase/invertase (TIGR01784 family)